MTFFVASEVPGSQDQTVRTIVAHAGKLAANRALMTRFIAAYADIIDWMYSDDPRVLTYLDILAHNRLVGHRVAVIGAGGIGFDVAEFLIEHAPSPTTDVERWTREWGVDMQLEQRGGLKLAILSNGSTAMLAALVKNSGLDAFLDATISVA